MEYYRMSPKEYNGLTLAYIGDAIYEIYIRKYVLSLSITKVNDLHKEAILHTSAKAQANAIHYFLNHEILTEDEIRIYKRGRNAHVHTFRKNMSMTDYLDATGFEALLGYLYLDNQIDRLEKLVEISIHLD